MDKRWLCILWTKQGWIDILDRDLLRDPPGPDVVKTHFVMPKSGGEPLPAKFTIEVQERTVQLHYSEAKEAREWNTQRRYEWDPGTMHLYFSDNDFQKLDMIRWQMPGKRIARADPYKEVSLKEVSGGTYLGGTGHAVRRIATVAKRDSKFRRNVLGAYGNRCSISGCPVVIVLEAAHIAPHAGSASDVVSNSLLLRRDLHALFDAHLLGIDPDRMTVHFSPSIRKLGYTEYLQLEGGQASIREPGLDIHKPDRRLLWKHWKQFQKAR